MQRQASLGSYRHEDSISFSGGSDRFTYPTSDTIDSPSATLSESALKCGNGTVTPNKSNDE